MKIAIDIETIPSGKVEDTVVKVPGNYKKQESIDKYIEEHREEEYRRRALNGLTCEIVSVAFQPLGYADQPVAITRNDMLGEQWLLESLFVSLADFAKVAATESSGRDVIHQFVGHNVIDFDLRILWQRCVVNRVQPTIALPKDARSGTDAIDTMKEWCGQYGGRQPYVKQDDLYAALGGELPVGEEDGSMVFDWWTADCLATLTEYNIKDVKKVVHIYEAMQKVGM